MLTLHASLPALTTFRCISIEARGRWIYSISRVDLYADRTFGYELKGERQGIYDPAALQAPVCNDSDLEGAIWRPNPPDVLVVASRTELDLVPRAIVRTLPVIVLSTVAGRLWAGADTELGALCHEREVPMEPARAMPATLVRAWQMGQITQAALRAVWSVDDLVAISACETQRGNRHMRRRQKACCH